jgi:hypothetical protein
MALHAPNVSGKVELGGELPHHLLHLLDRRNATLLLHLRRIVGLTGLIEHVLDGSLSISQAPRGSGWRNPYG